MAEKFSTGDVNVGANAYKTAYANGIIAIFGTDQPATSNDAEGGSPLVLLTNNGGPFTAGVATNGINLSDPVDGVLSKASGETWSGIGLAAAGTGTQAKWFRHYANAYVTGASTTAVRYDGAIGTSASYEGLMVNLNIVEGVPVTCNGYTRTVKRTA